MRQTFTSLVAGITLAVLITPVQAQRVQGMDVSQFQTSMNWTKAYTAGARFAFVRAGRGGTTTAEGKQDDTVFTSFMSGAASAGILTGCYLRARPDLAEVAGGQPSSASIIVHADDEALNFYNLTRTYLTPTHIRPVLDLEGIPSDVPSHPGTVALDKPSMTLWANEFLDHFESLSGGIEPIVYVNTDYATNRLNSGINSPSRRTLWIARPFTENPSATPPVVYSSTSEPQTPNGYPNPYGQWNVSANPDSSWDFWQYDTSGNGSTYGAGSANLDLDVFNGDLNRLKLFMIPEPGTGLVVVAVAIGALRRSRRTRVA